jgi:hypothetical protein
MNRASLAGLVSVCIATAALADDPANVPAHHPAPETTRTTLTQSGQAAFAALGEAVAVFEADPTTDWSKVNITQLRDHLVDMDEVLMRSEATLEQRPDSIRINYTGTGRTLAAIQRMIPANGAMMNGFRGWKSTSELQRDGATWTIFTSDPEQQTHIRALGPFGLLTLGSHHLIHHLAMAKGLQPHEHGN